MNAELVAVGIYENRSLAAGQVERFMSELYFVTAEMLDCLVEISTSSAK